MSHKRRLIIATIALIFCAPLIDSNVWLFALQNRVSQPQPVQVQTKPASERTSSELSTEISKLTKELHELHVSQRRMLDIMILQAEQGRAEKLEDRLFTINGTIRTLLSREAQIE